MGTGACAYPHAGRHLRRFSAMAKKKEQQQTEDENFNFIVRIVNTDIDGQKKTV